MSNAEHIRLEELELLALGALPWEKAAAIEAHVSGCEECALKLAQARGNAALLSFAVKQERPAGTVKAELVARIRANREAQERNAWPQKAPMTPSIPEPKARGSWWNWSLATAAVALALVSFGLSWQNRRIATELQKEHQAAEALIRDREQIEKLVRGAGGARHGNGETGGYERCRGCQRPGEV